MKILYCMNEQTGGDDLLWAFAENGHQISSYKRKLSLAEHGEDMELTTKKIYACLKEFQYEGVVSWNYFPAVSDACEAAGIPYMAWIYDSPLIHVFAANMQNSCNYLFIFDRKFAEQVKALGGNAYYLPLGINDTRLNRMVMTEDDLNLYSREISFVGSLYQDNIFDQVNATIPEDLRERLEGVFTRQLGDWNQNLLYGDIDQEDLGTLAKIYQVEQAEHYPFAPANTIITGLILSRKYAEIERRTVLQVLGSYYPVTLYNSIDQVGHLKNLECRPGVAYETETPKVYYASKINLNLTLKSIQTGIPLRCYDIMGAGGFLLSNGQEEFYEAFQPGEDLVLFHSMEELADLSGYYLRHESERMRITLNGYKKTTTEHTLRNRVAAMMAITYNNL